jgi:hypothetical protein
MNDDLYRAYVGTSAYSIRPFPFPAQPRENEVRVLERDGRRWLQQWRVPPGGLHYERAWVEVAELPCPRVRPAVSDVLRD